MMAQLSGLIPVVPIAVSTGFGWGPALLAVLNILVGGGITGGVIALIRVWPLLTKIKVDRELNLLTERGEDMEAFRERIDTLEKRLESERRAREDLKALHSAERASDRHRLNNVTQCFDALLLLIEAAPDKAAQAITKIKEMRATQMVAEAAEKAAIHARAIYHEGETG